MINSTAIDKEIIQKQAVGNIVNDIYLLPRWEIIRTFTICKNNFFFFKKQVKVNLLRKFSAKNRLEKYSVRTTEGKTLAEMDLRVYKDSVYIVNLEFVKTDKTKGSIEKLLQTAVEKAIYNTTNKEVFINLFNEQHHKWSLKRILVNNGFTEENSTGYERRMFGETYKFSANNCNLFETRIRQNPILINK